eukprot:g1462.t1
MRLTKKQCTKRVLQFLKESFVCVLFIELSIDGKKIGWSFFPQDEMPVVVEDDSEVEVPYIDMTSSLNTESLPELTRNQVLSTCCGVSGTILLLSFIVRSFAFRSPEVLGNDPVQIQALLSLTPSFSLNHGAIAFAAAGAVSLARVLLYQQWTEFKESTDRSNAQVLTVLNYPDLFVVSVFPGLSEEFLFRGGLIPSFYPDWRGVLLSGVIFGALHKGGGRNFAFVIWASVVGCLYGTVYLITQDVYVPIIAHSTANLFSALYWLNAQNTTKQNH